ncbi:MAG TPA: hypothetical protein VFE42_03955 [Chloroflexota bacterium]|nr:hypothetical protein [Chloroflexota bacterium]
MLRFKAFSGSDVTAVESQINAWLHAANPDVKLMDQSVATDGRLLVGFLYEEGFMAAEQRLSQQADAIVEHALKQGPLEPMKVDQEQV